MKRRKGDRCARAIFRIDLGDVRQPGEYLAAVLAGFRKGLGGKERAAFCQLYCGISESPRRNDVVDVLRRQQPPIEPLIRAANMERPQFPELGKKIIDGNGRY
ncbi:MAG: hypothetical protein WCA23_34605 [Stellaceae bacterium]